MNLKRIIALMLFYVMAMPSIATAKTSGGQDDTACIYGKTGAGFVIGADWYAGSELIRSDQIHVWEWRCMPSGQGVDHVVISLNKDMSGASGNAFKGSITTIEGDAAVAACAFTAGIGCIGEAGIVAGATAFTVGEGEVNIGDNFVDPGPWAVDVPLVYTDATKSLFDGGKNPHTNNYEGAQYIEIWGTVWDPQMLLHNSRCDGCL